MTTSPRLGFTELEEGETVPETAVNEIDRYLEQGAGHFIFKDRDLATPPGSPADGDCYLVAASPTGAWSGQAGKIAFRLNTAWAFITAKEGFTAYINDEDMLVAYNGSAWVSSAYTAENARDDIGAALTAGNGIDITVNDGADTITIDVDLSEIEASDSEMWTGTSAVKAVTPNKLLDAAVPQTLTDGATVTPDFNAGFNFEWTIGGNRTLANPTNTKSGQSGTIKVVQDATGSRVVSYGNNWRFPGGSASGGVLSTAANAIDLIAFTVGTDGKIYATLSKAFAA